MSESKKAPKKAAAARRQTAATLRSTSGAGFDFEDQISAWQLVKALVGEQMPGPGGVATQLQTQVSTLGWHIDDLLLTSLADDRSRRLAISAKGNVQVSATGLPEDFVTRAWVQWRKNDGPFDRDSDGLALVTLGAHPIFDATWREVKNACIGSDSKLSMSRIRSSPKQARVFESVRNPGGIPTATDEETINLIRRLHVIPLDLQLDHSETKNQAIAQCRRLLLSGDSAEAGNLWEHLTNIAKEVRLQSGTITIQQLLSRLRVSFQFRHHPDFESDWKTLSDITNDRRDRVETELPGGLAVPRAAEAERVRTSIEQSAITVVVGESGSGKSALVKSVLDSAFEALKQVWLDAEDLKLALSAARRHMLPLRHELSKVLNATVQAENVLVIDSAERIEASEFPVIRRKIFDAILAEGESSEVGPWRIVVITQPQSLAETEAAMVGERTAGLLEVGPLKGGEVKMALLPSPTLGWLAGHDDTIAALTNLRTLGWVLKAGNALRGNAGTLTTHTEIADKLWKYWTHDREDVQAFVMRLAEREASFERSFALTDFESSDAMILTGRPTELPLRKNQRTNRIEFEHDLAADWARFQFLKQIARDTPQWVELSQNPLWTNALRMLGQFLLREPTETGTEWDAAYGAAESAGNDLAADILLDALCLDPNAAEFLTQRIDLLLADRATRLDRMLVRFHHIATVPTAGGNAGGALSLYMESRFRSVVIARWPAVLQFLTAHRRRLNDLVSTALAKIIQTWLIGTPRTLSDGSPFPFRRELAEIALDMARTVQVEKGRGVIYLIRDQLLYTAPLSAAGDLPVEIGNWALELAGRRPIDLEVKKQVEEAKRKEAEIHRERLESDTEYRADFEARRRASFSIPSFRQRLPPWPLGANRRVDMDFRTACLSEGGLQPLMKADPNVASEVLLALLIEDEPFDTDGSSGLRAELGLNFARDAYPVAYWKSPFFPFLHIAPDPALSALIALVNFCTERWLHGVVGDNLAVDLALADGSRKSFSGTWPVFNWVQSSSMQNGHLYCALDALERWVTSRLDIGGDVDRAIETILRDGNSAALISVLVNVAKHKPMLLRGPLAPLLSSPDIFRWDSARMSNTRGEFAAPVWSREGEVVFNLARDWAFAAHRGLELIDVVVDLLKTDDEFARGLRSTISTWSIPEDPRKALDVKVIAVALTRENYQSFTDPETGVESLRLIHPEELIQEIRALQEGRQPPLRDFVFPDRCEERLQTKVPLEDKEAEYLGQLLKVTEGDAEDDSSSTVKLAAAATLMVLGGAWLDRNSDVSSKAETLVRIAVSEIPSTGSTVREGRFYGVHDGLRFVAYAAVHLWMIGADATSEWEQVILRLLTSGDKQAASTVVRITFDNRAELGPSWWRLLCAGVLWSGLALLAPRGDEEEGATRNWERWLERLRRYPLRGRLATWEDIHLQRVAHAYGRLEYQRRQRASSAGDRRWFGRSDRPPDISLDTDFLEALFEWLLKGAGAGDRSLDIKLALEIWEFEAIRAKARGNGDYGEYDLPSQNLGYDILIKLAELCLAAPTQDQRTIWESVLKHGPEAHYALQHFIDGLYIRLGAGDDPTAFQFVWREIANYGLAAPWSKKGLWFHGERLLGDILGFGNVEALQLLPPGAALRMKDVYEQWARGHLATDDECIGRFCYFLSSPFGSPLRLDGLRWTSAALRAREGFWYRDETGTALAHLVATSLQADAAVLGGNSEALQALLDIAAMLVSKNVPTALALQERIKRVGSFK